MAYNQASKKVEGRINFKKSVRSWTSVPEQCLIVTEYLTAGCDSFSLFLFQMGNVMFVYFFQEQLKCGKLRYVSLATRRRSKTSE